MTGLQPLAQAITVRLATPDDGPALLRLHHEGFDSAWTEQHWRWRFVQNPTGRTAIAGAFGPDGRCVAAFCGVPLAAHYRGEAGFCTRAGDVVVHPQLRQSVVGSKLLVKVGDLFFTTFGGGSTRIVYGCPELALRRTAVRHLRCEIWGDLPMLIKELGSAPAAAPGISTGGVAVAIEPCLPADIDGLCAAQALQVPTGLARDPAFLRWRYDRNPLQRYQLLVARGADGDLRGLGVVRRGGLHESALSMVELMLRRGDDAAEAALLAAAERRARAVGLPMLLACFAPRSPEFVRLQRHGFCVHVSHHQIVFRTYAAGVDRRLLFEEWFYSLGDFDFG